MLKRSLEMASLGHEWSKGQRLHSWTNKWAQNGYVFSNVIRSLSKCQHTLVAYNTVQYKKRVHVEYLPDRHILQILLRILQRKLQRRPGPDTNTRNTQTQNTGARGSLQPGFNQVIPLHQQHTHTHTHKCPRGWTLCVTGVAHYGHRSVVHMLHCHQMICEAGGHSILVPWMPPQLLCS